MNKLKRSGFWLAIHPGSGSVKKNWPEENWARLLLRLVEETNCCFLIIGGESEVGIIEKLGILLPSERTEIAQDVPLVDLAYIMQSCTLFIGHDSGITHLAGALGMERIILWGPSNKLVWGPRDGKFNIIEHQNGIQGIRIDDVWSALEKFGAVQSKS